MKRVAAAADRNKQVIADALKAILPEAGKLLELASGTGQHAVFLACAFPALEIVPSDIEPLALESIEAYRREARLTNLHAPLQLDAEAAQWPISEASAVLCINMIHIAPWRSCIGLLRGAARILPSGSPLILYGPFSIDGDYTAESNIRFDQRLRSENPKWGVRELRDIESAAEPFGLYLDSVRGVPANNHIVVFRAT